MSCCPNKKPVMLTTCSYFTFWCYDCQNITVYCLLCQWQPPDGSSAVTWRGSPEQWQEKKTRCCGCCLHHPPNEAAEIMAFTFAAFCYMLALLLTAALIFFAIWHVSTRPAPWTRLDLVNAVNNWRMNVGPCRSESTHPKISYHANVWTRLRQI